MPSLSYTVLFANGRRKAGTAKLPDKQTTASVYAVAEKVVRGVIGDDADVEHVRVWDRGQYRDMFVDEIGHHKHLPLNEQATAIYRANSLAHEQPPPDPDEMPTIVGDAVLFDQQVWK